MAAVPVIHDADHDGDCDDVGDDGSFCYWQSQGAINIIAAGLTSGNAHSTDSLAAVYLHCAGYMPPLIGAYKGSISDAGSSYNSTIAANYPHPGVGPISAQPNSVTTYRQILAGYEAAGSPSVWFVVTGGLNSMSDLLQSSGDGASASNGITLVTNSCAGMVIVAGRDGAQEFNTELNRPASHYVFANCPVTLAWCDIRIGDNIVMAQNHFHGNLPASCPVRVGYDLDGNSGHGANGRNAWSQLGIEYVAGSGVYATQDGTFAVDLSTGIGTWTAGAGTHKRLQTTLTNSAYATRWEAQVVDHPESRGSAPVGSGPKSAQHGPHPDTRAYWESEGQRLKTLRDDDEILAVT